MNAPTLARRWWATLRAGTNFEWFAVVPLVVAAGRALVEGWIPMGENALMSLRARDVLTDHHPWLGTASSRSLTTGAAANHPGPLAFDLFALPVRVLGSAAGLVVGAVLLHAAAVLVAGAAARRAGGNRLVVLTTLAFLALEWTLGPQLMLDPWNPHLVLLPFMAFLTCVAAVACGHPQALLGAVVFGSLALQTHVSYVLLVPIMGLGAAIICLRRRWSMPGDGQRWMIAAGVLAVLWAQPLWQQFIGPGKGNIGIMLNGDDSPSVGIGRALRIVAEVMVVPPFWLRPSFERSIGDMPIIAADGGTLPAPSWLVGEGWAVLLVGALLAALAAEAWICHRRALHAPAAWLMVAGAGSLLAVATVAIIPASGYGIAPHQVRWLWPLALWWMLSVAYATIELTPAARRLTRARWLPPSAATLAIVLCVPSYVVPVGVARAPGSAGSVRSIVAQMSRARVPEAVYETSGMWIGEPYSVPVLETLFAHDQPVGVAADAVAQFGATRAAAAGVANRLYMRYGARALACGGGERLALVGTFTSEQLADYAQLQRQVVEMVARWASDPALAHLLAASDATLTEAVADGRAEQLLAAVGTVPTPAEDGLLAAFDTMRASLGFETVAVFVGPIGASGDVCSDE